MIGSPEPLSTAVPSGQNVVATRKSRPWAPLVFLLLAAGVGFYFLKRAPQKSVSAESPNEVPVATIKVATSHHGNMGSYIEALGTVTPLATVNLYSQVNGVVVSVHYTEGQIVHRGDPLIDIDPRPYEAQLQQAQGTLERDRALLKQAEIDLARYEKANNSKARSRTIWGRCSMPRYS
jgi:multidrug efflux system membrane fusion protein